LIAYPTIARVERAVAGGRAIGHSSPSEAEALAKVLSLSDEERRARRARAWLYSAALRWVLLDVAAEPPAGLLRCGAGLKMTHER